MEYFWEGRINTKKYNNKWKERNRHRERKKRRKTKSKLSVQFNVTNPLHDQST